MQGLRDTRRAWWGYVGGLIKLYRVSVSVSGSSYSMFELMRVNVIRVYERDRHLEIITFRKHKQHLSVLVINHY